MNKNNVIKIPVHSKIKIFFIFLILLALVSALAAFMFSQILISNTIDVPDFVFYTIFLAIIVLGSIIGLPKIFDKKGYLSTIEITTDDITLIYKMRGKISNRITVPTKNIKSFFAEMEISEYHSARRYRIDYELKIFIKTKGAPIPITINNYFCNAKSLMLKLAKYSSYIPNFSYKVKGYYLGQETETPIITGIKREIDYCAMHGKKMPIIKSLCNFWSSQNLVYNLAFIILIFSILYILYFALRDYFPIFFNMLRKVLNFLS